MPILTQVREAEAAAAPRVLNFDELGAGDAAALRASIDELEKAQATHPHTSPPAHPFTHKRVRACVRAHAHSFLHRRPSSQARLNHPTHRLRAPDPHDMAHEPPCTPPAPRIARARFAA